MKWSEWTHWANINWEKRGDLVGSLHFRYQLPNEKKPSLKFEFKLVKIKRPKNHE